MLCPNCKIWEIPPQAADRYCGWCGASRLSVECQALPPALYFSTQDQAAPHFELSVRNSGTTPVEVIGVEADPAGCAFFSLFTKTSRKSAASQKKPSLTIAPGETRVLSGYFQMAALQALFAAFAPEKSSKTTAQKSRNEEQPANGFHEISSAGYKNGAPHGLTARFALLLDGNRKGPSCTLKVVLRPEFELLTPTLEVIEAGDTDSESVACARPGSIRLRQGSARVQHLESEIPGIKLELLKPQELQAAANAGEKNGVFNFRLEIERHLLEQHLESGRPLQTGVKLVCEDPPGRFTPKNAPLQIIARSIPRLAVISARREDGANALQIRTWALAGRTRDFMLPLKNESRRALEIYAIEATGTLDCLKRKGQELPLRLAPHQTAGLSFMLDTQTCPANTAIVGALALRYRSEAAESFSIECGIHLEVRAPQTFPGVAAIDFGAAQSCVAISELQDERHARLVKIHGDPFVPTAILYQSIAGERVYEIGSAAFSTKPDKDTALHVAQDFKPRLGQALSRQIYLTRTKQIVKMPYDVVLADYLRGLLRAAEHHLAEKAFRQNTEGMNQDFSRCELREILLIAPATFTFKQKEALRQALTEAGIPAKANVQLLPAPVVSACAEVDHLAAHWQQEMQSGKNPAPFRHLLIYEMGAGATEIALVRVELQPQTAHTLAESENWRVEFKVLGCEGDEQFGGNNLTAALAKHLAQQALAQLEAKFKTKIVLPLWHRLDQTPGKRLEQVGYMNWKRLLRRAESLKCQFADLALPARLTLPRLALQILVDRTFRATHVENLVVSSALLEKVVAERMALHVRRIQNLLRHAKLQAPDRIVLAGMSTLLPGVRQALAGAFAAHGCEVEYLGRQAADPSRKEHPEFPSLHDLKAAAALGGAKYLRLLKTEGELHLKDSRPIKTAMRIGFGLRHNGGMQFVPVIEKNIVVGTECPVPPIALRWETELPIYATVKTGALNLDEEAELLGHFRLAQLKPAVPADLDDAALALILQQRRLRLKLTRHHELHVLLRLRGREHAGYFELD